MIHDEYRRMEPPPAEAVERCPLCGNDAHVWEFSETPADIVQRVVMCERGDDIGPRSGLVWNGCLLYMPPQDFYKATGRDAVRYWNEYARATAKMRRANNWKHARVLREEPHP